MKYIQQYRTYILYGVVVIVAALSLYNTYRVQQLIFRNDVVISTLTTPEALISLIDASIQNLQQKAPQPSVPDLPPPVPPFGNATPQAKNAPTSTLETPIVSE